MYVASAHYQRTATDTIATQFQQCACSGFKNFFIFHLQYTSYLICGLAYRDVCTSHKKTFTQTMQSSWGHFPVPHLITDFIVQFLGPREQTDIVGDVIGCHGNNCLPWRWAVYGVPSSCGVAWSCTVCSVHCVVDDN